MVHIPAKEKKERGIQTIVLCWLELDNYLLNTVFPNLFVLVSMQIARYILYGTSINVVVYSFSSLCLLSTTTTVSKWLLLLTTGCYTSLLLIYSTPLLLLLYSNPLFTTSKLSDFDLQGSSNHVAAVNSYPLCLGSNCCFFTPFPLYIC